MMSSQKNGTSPAEVAELQAQWPGESYDLLHRNCVHFCDALCVRLGVGPLPGWVNRFAHGGAVVSDGAAAVADGTAQAWQVTKTAARELDAIGIVGHLAAEWSEAYLSEGETSLAAFWAVQHLTLERLSERIQGRDFSAAGPPPQHHHHAEVHLDMSDFSGLVVRSEIDPDDLEYGV